MFMYVDIKHIEELPEFIRRKKARGVPKQSDEYLRDSIKNAGMKEPLTLLKREKGYILVKGYRRLKAIRELQGIGELPRSVDPSSLPAVVHDKVSPSVLRYMVDLRQDIPYSLRAHYIRRLVQEHNKKKSEIAQLYGVCAPSIENWLVIARCIPEVQKAIDSKRYPMSAGKIFSTLTKEGQRVLQAKLRDYDGVTRDRINTEARGLSKSHYNIPDRDKRKSMAKSLISAKTGLVHTNRTELRVKRKMVMDDIVVAEKELQLLERQVKFYSDTNRRYASVLEIWLRTNEIRDHIKSNYPEILSDISEIVLLELGVKV